MKRAACSSRQKSLRGFAKCARGGAETRPGLMPTKTTRRFGARTSGTALGGLGGFGARDEPFVETLLEAPAEILTGDPRNVARTAWLEPDDLDGRVVAAVTTGVALGFRQRTKAPHDSKRMNRSGRHNPRLMPTSVKPKELRYAVDLARTTCAPRTARRSTRTRRGRPSTCCSPRSSAARSRAWRYHARRAGNAIEEEHGSARALITKRESDGRYATTEIDRRARHSVYVAVRVTTSWRRCSRRRNATASSAPR